MSINPTSGARSLDSTPLQASEAVASAAQSSSSPGDMLSHFTATSAQLFQGREGQTIKLQGPFAMEFGATLTFSNFGRGGAPGKPVFTIETGGGIPHSSQPARPMTKDEEKSVLAALQHQMESPHSGGADRKAIQAFIDRLTEAVAPKGPKPSTVFDAVRWGDCKKDGHGGVTAEGGVGVDQIMSVHADKHGKLTYSVRLAMGHLPGAVATPLTAADKADLIKSVGAHLANVRLTPDSPWNTLLKDAQK